MVAKKDDISKKQVLFEMQKAIDEGYNNPYPNIRAEWDKISCKGDRPIPEELISYEVDKLRKK